MGRAWSWSGRVVAQLYRCPDCSLVPVCSFVLFTTRARVHLHGGELGASSVLGARLERARGLPPHRSWTARVRLGLPRSGVLGQLLGEALALRRRQRLPLRIMGREAL